MVYHIRLINHNAYFRWVKSKLPVAFLKQQTFLIAIIVGSFLLVILTTFFTPQVKYKLNNDITTKLNFGVVVDCGSSGTRANIFTWTYDNSKVTNLDLYRNDKKEPFTKHITPGLSSIRDEPDKASEYMEPVMDYISAVIPHDRHLDTPIYFMATAGMRLLDDLTQQKILSDIKRDLRVKYNFPKIKSQVITGEYEGIYSWLSINANKTHNKTQDPKSFGMIEVGGASIQVAFEINTVIEQEIIKNLNNENAISAFRNEQIDLKLHNNYSVKLFATTFLGSGVNSARDYAIDLLARDYLEGLGILGGNITDRDNFQMDLIDPCLTIGSVEHVTRSYELISTKDRTIGFSARDNGSVFMINLEGGGNFLNCLTLLERVIKAIKSERINCPSGKKLCPNDLLGTDFMPYKQFPFLGLSEMYFTTNEMIHSAGHFNRTHLLQETNRICSTHFDKLQKIFSSIPSLNSDRIMRQCFKASWLLTILHSSGLRMPVAYRNFQTVDRWDGQEIDWTFGALLWELDMASQ